MSLVRLLGFTTLGCGVCLGPLSRDEQQPRSHLHRGKGHGLRPLRPPAQPARQPRPRRPRLQRRRPGLVDTRRHSALARHPVHQTPALRTPHYAPRTPHTHPALRTPSHRRPALRTPHDAPRTVHSALYFPPSPAENCLRMALGARFQAALRPRYELVHGRTTLRFYLGDCVSVIRPSSPQSLSASSSLPRPTTSASSTGVISDDIPAHRVPELDRSLDPGRRAG